MNRESAVLIVEDEAIISLALSQHLKEFGYRVTDIVHSGEAAIDHCLASAPDIILMDIVLKGNIDGISAAEKINARINIPVIFLTAYSDEETVERAAGTAPYGYITKPYDPQQVRATIETAINKSSLETKLRESEQWYTSTLRSVGDAVIATDPEGNIRFMNPVAETLTDTSFEDVKNKNISKVLKFETSDFIPMKINPVQEALDKKETQTLDYGANVVSLHGYRTPVTDSASPIFRDDGELIGAVLVLHDVSKEIELIKSVEASEHRFQSAFMQAATGCALIEIDDRFRQVNPALSRMLGYSESELNSIAFSEILHSKHHNLELEYRDRLIEGGITRFFEEWQYVRRDGSTFWGLTSGALISNDNDEPEFYIYQVHDISDRIQLESRLSHLANYDSLTGLLNRSRLQIEIQRAIASARRYRKKFGIVFIDLDNFKHVNDSLGHDIGDTLLKDIGKRLEPISRETDVVARLGGDEFVVLVNDIIDPQDIITVTDKIRTAIAIPVTISDKELRMSASIGISVFPEDGNDVKSLLRNADGALYKAKEEGHSAVAFYSSDLTLQSSRRLDLESRLRKALEQHEFVLHYQPVVKTGNGKLYCFEALLRWMLDKELVPPDSFIPIAEETGLIVPIGNWVLQEACRQAVEWEESGYRELMVSVNVSARQIRESDFVEFAASTLDRTGLPADRLWLELTESQLVGVDDATADVLAKLREMGISLAIDDFGVGYSSLNYLKHLSPKILKIDRSFLKDVTRDADDAAIVSATIAMAHKLGLQVVAEGVEDREQLSFLEQETCDALQGYYFSKPLPAQKATALLNSDSLFPK